MYIQLLTFLLSCFAYEKFWQTFGILDLKVRVGIERVTGRKARGPQAAEGNKLQVVDAYFFLYTKLKKASF